MAGAAKRKMHLGVFLMPTGHHVAAWLHPDAQPDAPLNLPHIMELARTAERGKFDMVFLGDGVAVRKAPLETLSRTAQYTSYFEPMTLLSVLSTVTTRVGLVATASTSYSYPYYLARLFASLDHLSGGRAGWNIVTSSGDEGAQNFSRTVHYEHDERYVMAQEFTDVCLGLWDSWEDDAFLHDREQGRYFDPAKLHTLNHKGKYYQVKGPLSIARPPQGYPVLVQAGGSDAGRQFAAGYAEVVFSAQLTLKESQDYYADLKERAAKLGRDPTQVKILPGFSVLVGRTKDEAEEKFAKLKSRIDPLVAREALSVALGRVDLSPYPFDGPMPDLPMTQGSQSAFKTVMKMARDENLTIRQLAMRMANARQRMFICGDVQTIADTLEEWFTSGAADGFNILPPYLPGSFNDFVDLVVPELQRRGLFRDDYEGTTLRDHLGLVRPANRHAAAAKSAAD